MPKRGHTQSGDSHYDLSPNEDHHMEGEVLFHSLFHPSLLY